MHGAVWQSHCTKWQLNINPSNRSSVIIEITKITHVISCINYSLCVFSTAVSFPTAANVQAVFFSTNNFQKENKEWKSHLRNNIHPPFSSLYTHLTYGKGRKYITDTPCTLSFRYRSNLETLVEQIWLEAGCELVTLLLGNCTNHCTSEGHWEITANCR